MSRRPSGERRGGWRSHRLAGGCSGAPRPSKQRLRRPGGEARRCAGPPGGGEALRAARCGQPPGHGAAPGEGPGSHASGRRRKRPAGPLPARSSPAGPLPAPQPPQQSPGAGGWAGRRRRRRNAEQSRARRPREPRSGGKGRGRGTARPRRGDWLGLGLWFGLGQGNKKRPAPPAGGRGGARRTAGVCGGPGACCLIPRHGNVGAGVFPSPCWPCTERSRCLLGGLGAGVLPRWARSRISGNARSERTRRRTDCQAY